MNDAVEALVAELSRPQFRWWRRAPYIGLPASLLFIAGVLLELTQGNGMRFLLHPLVLITFGAWLSFLGVLLISQPSTYLAWLWLHRVLRHAEKGRGINEDTKRRRSWRERIAIVFGGTFALLIGLLFVMHGISEL